MTKLKKTMSQLYVGTLPSGGENKYYGTPRNAWFHARRPYVTTRVEVQHKLDHTNKPWDEFCPTAENFKPWGHRELVVFERALPTRRQINAEVQPAKDTTWGKIGEEGEGSFEGKFDLLISCADEEAPPSGYVHLMQGDPRNARSQEDVIYIVLRLPADHLEVICADLSSRQNVMLGLRFNFAHYRNEMDERLSEWWHPRKVMLEPGKQVPILEAQVEVVDRPEEDEDKAEPESDMFVAAPPPTPISSRPNFQPLLNRLSWTIGLLLLLVLISLFK